jgi:pyruvate formate lyase activating enzyme
VDACPTEARQAAGREWSVAKLVETVLRDRVFYDDSGGGVTFSGGEPLAQFEFLRAALLACRAEGLHTAVDTCGLARTEDLLAVASLADLILYDLKFMDEAKHREYTGVSNGMILENLGALGRAHRRIWVRVPVIPGINDSDRELDATAQFAAAIPGVQRVDLLPYHRTGLEKLRRLGRSNPLAEVLPPSAQALAGAVKIFQMHGLAASAAGG